MKKLFVPILFSLIFFALSSPNPTKAVCGGFNSGNGLCTNLTDPDPSTSNISPFTNCNKQDSLGNDLCCSSRSQCDAISELPTPTPTPIPDPGSVTAATSPHGDCGNTAINTALGCLDFTGTKTIQTILNWSIVVGGGIVFIMIITAGFQITTAQGDAKKAAASRELITSALAGLVLLVISVVLLNFIGVNVLGLDKLGFKVGP